MKMQAPISIYQIALRSFTPDGTFAAATRLLPHVASLGVNTIYVCPFFAAENVADEATWSQRQKASATGNPKNPYKISDFFAVDEEYGTEEDGKAFVREAHRVGLKVLFDLVYDHCGKTARILEEHPDFVERNEDGSIRSPERWPFAKLNFESPALRRYLKDNMQWLVRDWGVDGFRCDVADLVPLDFWRESFAELAAIREDLILINEGKNPDYLEAFQWEYGFEFTNVMPKIFGGNLPATRLTECYQKDRETYGDGANRLLRSLENHDKASDVGLDRIERTMTSKGVEAALAVVYTFPGAPFLWNGCEVGDDAENSMFSNRFYGRRSQINWSRGFTEEGQRRLSAVRAFHALYSSEEALRGEMTFVENSCPEQVISYSRGEGTDRILVVVNAKGTPCRVSVEAKCGDRLLSRDCEAETNGSALQLGAYGYLIAREL